jgi:hypothetical protein
MADIRPGEPFTPGFLIKSPNGSIETSGVSGTLVLDSPSATAVTSGALAHQGGGVWGYTIAGSFTGTPGTYTYRVASLVTPSGTLVNQSDTFEVGFDNAYLVRDLYTQLREDLNDGWTGTTDLVGTTTTLKCAAFARESSNDWVDSEIFIFEQGAVTDPNPVRVTAFSTTAGTFTFTPAVGSNVAAGTDFIIGNKDGQGFSHAQVMNAMRRAVRQCGYAPRLTDEISLTFSTTTAEYTVPAGFADVTELAYQPPNARTGEWLPIARGRYWEWQPDRRRVVFTRMASGVYGSFVTPTRWGQGFDIPQNSKLRVTGRARIQIPTAMGATIDADPVRVYDTALMLLLMESDDGPDRQRAVMVAGAMGRPPVRMPG